MPAGAAPAAVPTPRAAGGAGGGEHRPRASTPADGAADGGAGTTQPGPSPTPANAAGGEAGIPRPGSSPTPAAPPSSGDHGPSTPAPAPAPRATGGAAGTTRPGLSPTPADGAGVPLPSKSFPADSVGMVEQVFREERGRLLAALSRRFGDLDLAEEVTSEAIEIALQKWPVDGVPPKPGAWLMTTARRKAVDRLRRDKTYAARLALLHVEAERTATPADVEGEFPDDRLQLFFTCAHPALPAEDRVALTLRCLAGLTTPEVARAFLVPTATMAKRIVRAKKKIREARIPFRVPATDELPERLPGVLQVTYSIFTEGYAASFGADLQRVDLAEEAIRLARILHRLMPTDRETAGLLALMLLIHARRDARTGPDGELVLLDEQNRARWDRTMIEEGRALVLTAVTGPPGPYGIQAAIASLHDEAANVATTDWPQIVALYDVLLALVLSPVIALNRAAAIALRDGPEAGLNLIDELAGEPLLQTYHPYHLSRADLLQRLGRLAEAAEAYREALALAGTSPERRHVEHRLHQIAAELQTPGEDLP
jgi:RNA polymerase sigma-70 factor (ECF subfamily)